MTVAISTLRNGVRIVTHRMAHLETVSLGVWVATGSRSESAAENGLAHLLEHMAFKGSKRRSARDIAEEIEAVGGELNAATSLETTAYYARVLKDDVPLALDILADIILEPRFDSGELEREKDVILQEIAAAQDCPDELAFDLAQEAAFPAQALGRPILGTAARVRGFRPDDLRAYLETHYSAEGMVVAAAGNVEHAAIERLSEELFAGLRARAGTRLEGARYAGGFRKASGRFEQNHLVVAFQGPAYGGDDIYAAQLLATMLGGGMSSRLFQEARERRGLCYAIYSFCWGVSDTGLFGVHAATGAERVDELVGVVAEELRRASEEPPSDSELARAKTQLKAGLLMSLESSGARAEQLARQTLAFGRPLGIEELIGKVDAVTPEAVRRAAARIIDGSPPSLAFVGSQAGDATAAALSALLGGGEAQQGGEKTAWRS